MTRVEFIVSGKPVPQGSARAFVAGGHAHVTNDPDGTINKWRSDIREAARGALPASFELLRGDVRATATFLFGRPKSHYLPVTKSRPEPVLRPDAPTFCAGRGDVDKHLRSLFDALIGVVYADDEQVVELGRVVKLWARDPGAVVVVAELVP